MTSRGRSASAAKAPLGWRMRRSIRRSTGWKRRGGSTRSGACRRTTGGPSSTGSPPWDAASSRPKRRAGGLTSRRSPRSWRRLESPMRSNRRIPGRRLFRFPWRTAAQVAADVDEELQLHLDLAAQELVDAGWLPEAARVEAVRRFGDLEGTRKACSALDRSKETQMKWMQMLEALGQDVRFAGRQLAKSPGFTFVIVLTLALAVGASTSIFSVVHGILLKPLPFGQSDRLLWAMPLTNGEEGGTLSYPNF